MDDTKTLDISAIRFSSTVNPTEADIALWESLTPQQQRALIERDLAEADASGIAEHHTVEDILAEVRAENDKSP